MIIGYIKGQELQLKSELIVTDTIDYLTAKFVFKTADWQGLSKWAHFKKGSTVYDIPLTADSIKKSDHLNLAEGEWEVYLHGNAFDGGEVVERITTEVAKLTVKGTGSLNGEPFPEIPASETERINATLADHEERIEYLEEHGGGGGESYDDTELRNRISTIEGKEAGWNAKYNKPSGGIPKSDLASDVQTSLGRADTALQPDDLDDYALKSDLKEVGRACYNLLSKSVYTEDVTALMSALWGLVGANLVSISAVFTQGEAVVYPTTSLDSLKSMLVVTAHYDDSTTETVNDYTLSGTLAEGTSTITAAYSGKAATFNVNVSAEPPAPVLDYISAVYTQSGEVYESTALDDLKADLVVTAHLTDESTQTIDAADYTLSGTLAEGTSVVTVTYEDKIATFNVTVSAGLSYGRLYIPAGSTGKAKLGSYGDSDIKTIEITSAVNGALIEPLAMFGVGNADKWLGYNGEVAWKATYSLAKGEFSKKGKKTLTISNIETSYISSGDDIYLGYGVAQHAKETVIYQIRTFDANNALTHDYKPLINSVGSLYDDVTGETVTFNTTTGMAAYEIYGEVGNYCIHQADGSTPRFELGTTDDVTSVEMEVEINAMPTGGGGTLVFFSGYTGNWSGITNSSWSDMSADKTPVQIIGAGKTTFKSTGFANDGTYVLLWYHNSAIFTPNVKIYGIKTYNADNELTHNYQPTSALGTMYDSVTDAYYEFNALSGLSVEEV